MIKVVALMTMVLALTLAGAGCECPGYDSLEMTVGVHSTSGFDWSATVSRTTKTGIPAAFLTWEAAIQDAAAAAPGSGVMNLNGPGGALYLDVPLPLTTGQTLPVVRDDGLATAASFTNVGPPRTSLGARFEDFCTDVEPVDSPACDLRQPPIDGTAQVVGTSPLVIHLDFVIEARPEQTSTAHLVVRGDLVFAASRGRACPND